MPNRPLTLMAVHAHPDDEATSTGGVLARYASEGLETVVVTCTDGRCGDGPDGAKPGEAGHDPDEVAEVRRIELANACEALGVAHLELLGYRDSGMMGWPTNHAPGAFWGIDVDAAAERMAALMQRYRPDVVVTYDANGFYGHPDHIMAHRVATVAAESTGIPAKLYHTTIPRSGLADFAQALRLAGVQPPTPGDTEEGQYAPDAGRSPEPELGSPDEAITTIVDVGAWVRPKLAALAAHASQADNIFFLRLDEELFARFFGREHFIRVQDRTGAALPEDDLFAGLR